MRNDNYDLVETQKISNNLKSLELILEATKELRSLGQMSDESYIKNLNYVVEHSLTLNNRNNAI